MPKSGKDSDAARADDLSAGITKHYPDPKTQLVFGNETYTVADVTTKLQTVVSLRAATTQAQTAAKAKVAVEEAQLPALLAFMIALVAFVKATFGEVPDVLADFGMEPKKAPTPLTAEQVAAAVAKRKSTREARGTTGKKAKQAIKGNVTGVVVTPVSAPTPAASSPSPQPATATPAGSTPATGTGSGTPHS